MDNLIKQIEEKLHYAKSPHEKVEVLINIPENAFADNLEIAFELSKRALILSKEISFTEGIVKSLLNISICYQTNRNFKKAIEKLNEARLIAHKHNFYTLEAAALNYLGSIFWEKKDYETALAYFRDSIAKLKRSTDTGINKLKKKVIEENKKQESLIDLTNKELEKSLEIIQNITDKIDIEIKKLPPQNLSRISQIMKSKISSTINLVSTLNVNKKTSNPKLLSTKTFVDLAEIISEVVAHYHQYSEEKMLNIHIQIPNNKIHIRSNKRALTQIFHNLFSNALKYSKFGGEISLLVTDQPDQIAIEIIDEGPGFTNDELTSLFDFSEKFSSVYSKNIDQEGLGLLVVKRLSESLGAELQVTSEYGSGSSFILSLPK